MHRQAKSARNFERLERRSMMAGNVTAAVVAGNLTITGDDSANIISMQQLSSGAWQITGSGTKVNDAAKITTDPVTGSISINMAGGNDSLTMKNGNVPGHLTILMGDGNDVANLTNLKLGTFLHFEGNAGNDSLKVETVTVSDPTFAYFSSIDMQDGNDTVSIDHFTDQDLEVTLGAGNDHMVMTNSTLLGGPFQRLNIDAGDGTDAVSLSNVKTGPLTVEMGPGNMDALSLAKVTADVGTFSDSSGSSGLISGLNDHITSQTIDPNFVVRGGDLIHNI